MANTFKKLTSGTFTNGSATIYTVPAATKTLVKELIFCNKTAGAITVTLTYDGVNIVNAQSIAANTTLIIPCNSILEATKIMAGLASANTSIDYYISGMEMA